jgi:hypothetical protein
MIIIGQGHRAWFLALACLGAMLVAGCAGQPTAPAVNGAATSDNQTTFLLSPAQAAAHIGEQATVTGLVLSADYRPANEDSPTFLDFGAPYPTPVFIALIWGKDRAKFGAPEQTYNGQRVSVTGKITVYHDKPAIIVTDPTQIKIAQ